MMVLGRNYRIIKVSKPTMEKRFGEGCEACVSFEDGKIYILSSLSRKDYLIALFHESQHIAHSIGGLNQIINADTQELLCEIGAQAFYDVVRSVYGEK